MKNSIILLMISFMNRIRADVSELCDQWNSVSIELFSLSTDFNFFCNLVQHNSTIGRAKNIY